MERISSALLTFLLNAIWQVALVVLVGSISARLLRNAQARYRHAMWVAALLIAIALPLGSSIPLARRGRPVPQTPVTTQTPVPGSPEFIDETSLAIAPHPVQTLAVPAAVRQPFAISAKLANALVGLYLAFVLFRVAGLARAWWTTRSILRRSTQQPQLPPLFERVIQRCLESTTVSRVRVMTSTSLPAPLAIGFAPAVIILPEKLLGETDEAILTSAIGHELAHVQRRDYLMNLIYRLLWIPVSFHPIAALIRRRIDETRELRCDEVVTERLLSPTAYARSLVELAGAAHALRRPATVAVGIADADILEERIMSMLKKRSPSAGRLALLLLTSTLVLALPCIAAAPYAMHLNIHSSDSPSRALPAPVPTASGQTQEQPAKSTSKEEKMIGFAYVPRSQEQSQDESVARMKRKLAEERLAQQREILAKKLAEGQLTPEQAADLKKKLAQTMLMDEVNISPEERAARQKREQEELAARTHRLAELSKAAKITMQQAIDTALRQQPGTVMESALVGERKFITRTDDGSVSAATFANAEGSPAQPMYRIVILSGDENAPVRTIVLVSALDGSILRTAVE